MTIKKMYMHATTAQREGKIKPPAAVNEISQDNGTTDVADNKNDVAAFNRIFHWPEFIILTTNVAQ
jgi:hypothetical protein